MRFITLIFTVLFLFMSLSLCWAQEISVEKAYSLYYKGEKDMAIKMMEDYIKDNPDPRVFYFLGYAYYEMKKMNKAMEYFNEAYLRESFFSPMSRGNN